MTQCRGRRCARARRTLSTPATAAVLHSADRTARHIARNAAHFARAHRFMKVSCNRHVAEQRTSQTRTTRASAFYPFTQRRPKWRFRMHSRHTNRLLATFAAGVCIAATLGVAAADDNFNKGSRKTESPIEHVVIIVGENRSFDHIFATYVPTHRHHKVLNLLSQGIVKADGSPGPNF